MVNAQHQNSTNTFRSPGRVGVRRRVALFFLLFGWGAFWVVASLQHCCQLAAAQAHAYAANAVQGDTGSSNAGDYDHGHRPASPGDDCGSISVVALSALAVAAPAPSGDPAANVVYADMGQPRPLEPRAAHADAAHPPLPPPRAVAAFHLRTSRILI